MSKTEMDKRLIEIVQIAAVLKWVELPIKHESTMVMPAVEKCMIAMLDDDYLEIMRDWCREVKSGSLVEVNGELRPRNWEAVERYINRNRTSV